MSVKSSQTPVYVEGTIVIKASPAKVWNLLADIENWNKWLSYVSQTRLNGELKPATTFDWKAKGMKIHSTLQTVEPYSRLGWTGEVYGIHAVHNWSFKEVDGATEVSVNETMQGLLAKVFRRAFNKSLQKDMDQSLELLKRACE